MAVSLLNHFMICLKKFQDFFKVKYVETDRHCVSVFTV